MELLAVFALLTALLITALLYSRQSKTDFNQSDTPIGDQLAHEMRIKTWDD
jgi:hypothetical protein